LISALARNSTEKERASTSSARTGEGVSVPCSSDNYVDR